MERSVVYKLAALSYIVCGTFAARQLGRRRFDIVHVHWSVPQALFGWAARAATPRHPKVITPFYSIEVGWIRDSLPMLLGFLRRAITSADRVVAISGSTACEIQSVAPARVTVSLSAGRHLSKCGSAQRLRSVRSLQCQLYSRECALDLHPTPRIATPTAA